MTWPALADLAALTASAMSLSVLVTTLLLAVATMVQRLLRGAIPQRVVWGVALVASAGLAATQPWRRESAGNGVREAVAAPRVASLASPVAAPVPATAAERAVAFARLAGDRATHLVRVLPAALGAGAHRAPVAMQWFIVLAWPLASLLLVGVGAWSYRRQRRAVAAARVAGIDGHHVHVTPILGPAVFGVLRPQIVVPEWLFTRTIEEQRLVVQHEQAHIDARDPVLLMSACIAVALMPWNVGAWALLSRLRLAIEVDCDARVLQCGAAPRRYGALLIDLSSAAHPLPRFSGAPAFSHRASHLERRLRRMTDRPTTHRLPRRLAGASLATLALAAACGTELPTSAELEGMDVATATKTLSAVAPSAERQYFIDGRATTKVEAMALPANRIASIEVRKGEGGTQAIRLTTRSLTTGAATSGAETTVTASTPVGVATVMSDSAAKNGAKVVTLRITQIDSSARGLRIVDSAAKLSFSTTSAAHPGDTSRTLVTGDRLVIGDRMAFVPAGKTPDVLVMIDGVKSDESAMKRLSPSQIEHIEVIKGSAAEKLYGPEGAKGVIRITTKKPN